MNVTAQIEAFWKTLDGSREAEMRKFHELMLKLDPKIRLWFDEGKNEVGKQVTNPTIGYGFQIMHYANGSSREFFRIGISSNKTGITVYILGLKERDYLKKTYSARIGKAEITSYCIKFKKLTEVNEKVLMEAIQYGLNYASD